MIFSHAGEVGSTCDVCGRKYLHKHFGSVRAGHLTVCCNAHCIIDAMHSTGVPTLTIDEEMTTRMIGEVFNIPQKVVKSHIDLAKTVYTVMNNPNLVDYEMVHLLEAVIYVEFGEYETDVIEYAKTIDVMMKPYGLPTGRKSIDTNYPLASVVTFGMNQSVIPGFLDSLRLEMHSGNLHHEMEGGDFLLAKINILSGFKVYNCPEIPLSKRAIILGQLYMHGMNNINVFDKFETFRDIVQSWEYQAKPTISEIRKLHKEVLNVIQSKTKNYSEKATDVYNIISSVSNK